MAKSDGNVGMVVTIVLAGIVILILLAFIVAIGMKYVRTGELPLPLPDYTDPNVVVECPDGDYTAGQDCSDHPGCCVDDYSCSDINGFGTWRCAYIFPTCAKQSSVNMTEMNDAGHDWAELSDNMDAYEEHFSWYEWVNGDTAWNPTDYAYEAESIDQMYTYDFPCVCGDGSSARDVYVGSDTIGYSGEPFKYRYCTRIVW